jgi:hypothetical protein
VLDVGNLLRTERGFFEQNLKPALERIVYATSHRSHYCVAGL